MTPKDKLDIARDVIDATEADLLDPTTGQFKAQPDITDDIKFAGAVEAAYVRHGGTLNDNAQKAIEGVEAVLEITGLTKK